jgi:hypothetical protein
MHQPDGNVLLILLLLFVIDNRHTYLRHYAE